MHSNKIRVALVAAAIAALSFAAASLISLETLRANVRAGLEQRLSLALTSRLIKLERITATVEQDLALSSASTLVQTALASFTQAFRLLGEDPTAEVQRLYLTESPHGPGERHALVEADDGSFYSGLHGLYHPWFQRLMAARDYYDIFLINKNGDIVYSTFKEDDLGTNLIDGPYSGEAIGTIFRRALDAAPGTIAASDFAPYPPSAGLPAAFAGTPVYRDGKAIGVMLVQLRLDPIDEVMRASDFLGATGETYLANQDALMLTRARFADNDPFALTVENEAVSRALKGAAGFLEIGDYRGEDVLAVYRPFQWAGATWAAVAEIQIAEFDTGAKALARWLLIVGALLALLAGAIGWILAAPERTPRGYDPDKAG